MKFNRQFAMPNSETFSLAPVSRLLDRWLADVDCIVDPFARNSKRATLRNDLNQNTDADYHMTAGEFLIHLKDHSAGVVLFDPPYSPRQITECYQHIGRKVTREDTQNGHLYKTIKDELHRILRPGGVAISCGWNSMGFGLKRGYEMQELLLVPHGGAHNDTIITVERKL
jgi:hypothetical protein